MSKIKKWLIKLILLGIVIFGVGYVYYNYIDSNKNLTDGQLEIISILGYPEQFTLTYLPKGSDEGSEFIRHEIWFYPSMERKVTLLGGQVVATDELTMVAGSKYEPTQLRPEDFNFFSSLSDIEEQVGKDNLASVEIPGFFGEGVETYATKDAMFVFESGYLTYMETVN